MVLFHQQLAISLAQHVASDLDFKEATFDD
jgi:hypothetical protein